MEILLVLIALAITGAVALLVMFIQNARTYRREALAARAGVLPETVKATPRPSPFRTPKDQSTVLARIFPLSRESQERLAKELEQAGWSIGPGEYTLIRLLALLATPVVVFILMRMLFPEAQLLWWVAAAFGAVLGWVLPATIKSRAQQRRLRKIESQLLEALTTVSKSLRVGTGLAQALAYAAQEAPAPLGPELARTLHDIQLGSEDAFEALRERVGSQDLDVVVTAIMIQRTIGGNLSEILDNVIATIRERGRIRSEILVLTAEQRLSSNIIAFFPVVIAAVFILLQPTIGMRLFTTLPGQIALLVAIGFELLGLFVIRQLSHIDV